jgi:Ca2+-binding RTX toxin-like protein
VPQAILAQLGSGDAAIGLVVQGLEIGSTLSGNVSSRAPQAAPEGLFVQTFGADGKPVKAGLLLTGTAGDDRLIGDVGDDILASLSGDDVLTGGAGADMFVINSIVGTKTISDFGRGADRLDLTGIDANVGSVTDDNFVFIGTAPFGGRAGELRFSVANGVTTVLGDVDGDGIADYRLNLMGERLMVETDFIL